MISVGESFPRSEGVDPFRSANERRKRKCRETPRGKEMKC